MPFVSVDNGKDTYPFEVSTESGSFSTLSKDVSEHFELGAEFKLKTKNGNFTVSSDRTLSAALSYKSEGDELRLTLEVPNNTAPPLAPAPLTQSKAAGKRKASNSPGSAKKRGRELTPKEQGQKMAKLKEDHANDWGKLDAGKDATIAFGQYSMMDEGIPIKTSGDGIYDNYTRSLAAMFNDGCFVKMGDVLSEDALVKFDAWADEKNMEPTSKKRKDHKCGLNKFISLLRKAKEQGLLY